MPWRRRLRDGSSWCDASMRMSTSAVGMPILRARVMTGAANLPFCDGSTAPLTMRTMPMAYTIRSMCSERKGPTAPGTCRSCSRASMSAAVDSTACGTRPRKRQISTRASAASRAAGRSRKDPRASPPTHPNRARGRDGSPCSNARRDARRPCGERRTDPPRTSRISLCRLFRGAPRANPLDRRSLHIFVHVSRRERRLSLRAVLPPDPP